MLGDDARAKCGELSKCYSTAAASILEEEEAILEALNNNVSHIACRNLDLAELMLNLASNYMVIDGVFNAVLNLKHDEALNKARKALYKSIIYLEKTVGNLIDAPYSEYEAKVEEIEPVSPARRYYLIRKTGLAIQLLENAYGDNTKWRWAFVELEGRYAAAAKNIMNMRDVLVYSNFDSEHYEPTVRHLALVKKLLTQAADRYRGMYELSTNRIEDFKTGIAFLAALKRLNILTGDQAEAAAAKKKFDIWSGKLTGDIEKKEREKKQAESHDEIQQQDP